MEHFTLTMAAYEDTINTYIWCWFEGVNVKTKKVWQTHEKSFWKFLIFTCDVSKYMLNYMS